MEILDEHKTVGREGFVNSNGLIISVIIRDVRIEPLVVDYLVEPTAGMGSAWVNADLVRIDGKVL